MELDNDYTQCDYLVRNARDYTVVFDFNVNIPDKHVRVESVDGGPETE